MLLTEVLGSSFESLDAIKSCVAQFGVTFVAKSFTLLLSIFREVLLVDFSVKTVTCFDGLFNFRLIFGRFIVKTLTFYSFV